MAFAVMLQLRRILSILNEAALFQIDVLLGYRTTRLSPESYTVQ